MGYIFSIVYQPYDQTYGEQRQDFIRVPSKEPT